MWLFVLDEFLSSLASSSCNFEMIEPYETLGSYLTSIDNDLRNSFTKVLINFIPISELVTSVFSSFPKFLNLFKRS